MMVTRKRISWWGGWGKIRYRGGGERYIMVGEKNIMVGEKNIRVVREKKKKKRSDDQ